MNRLAEAFVDLNKLVKKFENMNLNTKRFSLIERNVLMVHYLLTSKSKMNKETIDKFL